MLKPRNLAGRMAAATGTGPVHRPKPAKSIGRDAARCYCQSCGRKRNVCTCGGDTR